MKKLSLLVLLFGFLQSCDVIDEPLKDGTLAPPTEPVRRVLIEDFTGHRCKNCPKASKEIKHLDSIFPGRTVALAIHAGPSNFTGTDTDYPTDWTTSVGDDWASFFSINFQPVGLISRVDWTSGGSDHLKLYPGWAEEANNIFALEPILELSVTGDYNGTTRAVNAEVVGEFLLNGTHDLKVMAVLKESHIIDNQLMPDDTRNPDYEHNNVFRTSFTGTWGDDFHTGAHDTTTVETYAFTGTVDNAWEASNCAVVAYVYDPVTLEIYQAVEVKLTEL